MLTLTCVAVTGFDEPVWGIGRTGIAPSAFAVDGDEHAILERLRRLLRADDRGHAQLARHDRRVARHPAFVGDDGRGALHRGHHVGRRHLRDEDVAGAALLQLLDVVDERDLARHDAGARAQS
jgi:hypothetical protein